MECKICGSVFGGITNTHLKRHGITLVEYKDKYGCIRDEELQKRMYRNHSQRMSEDRASGRCVPPPMSDKNRQLNRERMKNHNPMRNIDTAKKMGLTKKGRTYDYSFLSTNEKRKQQSDYMKIHNPMKTPEVAMKNAKSHNRLKSGIEKKFEKRILGKLPIRYVGNNKLWIGCKNPDYSIDGKNCVIEVTSNAYHRVENGYEDERIAHFEKYGYRCIIVRITAIWKDYEEDLGINLYLCLKKVLNEEGSYKVYHDKEGRLYCVQLGNEEKPQLFC